MNLLACPICGYPFADAIDEVELSESYSICPCCGCEYGLDDTTEYRAEWLAKGCPFFSAEKPAGWRAEEQLTHAVRDWVNFYSRPREGPSEAEG